MRQLRHHFGVVSRIDVHRLAAFNLQQDVVFRVHVKRRDRIWCAERNTKDSGRMIGPVSGCYQIGDVGQQRFEQAGIGGNVHSTFFITIQQRLVSMVRTTSAAVIGTTLVAEGS